MTATQKVYALLSASAGVTALVPAARIKPPGDWQNLAMPYIIHFPTPGTDITLCYDGPKAQRDSNHQISVYASDEGSAEVISTSVVSALNGHYEAGIGLIRVDDVFALGYDTDLKEAHTVVMLRIVSSDLT